MNVFLLEFKAALEACFTGQMYLTAFWHDHEVEMPVSSGASDMENLCTLVLREHCYNFQLWHVEDTARRRDVPDAVIAECKRKVDLLNQQRNDRMEDVDKCLYALLAPMLPQNPTARQNTETLGMALDRLSILALKVYHMEEQTRRTDANKEHLAACAEKLAVLRRQRSDLAKSILELATDYCQGVKAPVLYSQCKMYNDPSLNPELYARRKG